MENFEKCTVAMLGGPCMQHVTGNTSWLNQPQNAIMGVHIITWAGYTLYWPLIRRYSFIISLFVAAAMGDSPRSAAASPAGSEGSAKKSSKTAG